MRPITAARHFYLRLRYGGISWLGGAVRDRLAPARPSSFDLVHAALDRQSGLEIGGPSRLFRPRGGLPVYSWAERIDNVNFATTTAWESGLCDGGVFRFNPHRPAGRQFLREATALHGLSDGSYDFVLSSHCLEHVANPLGALREWRRVTRPGGHLLLVLPNPVHTFDHRRPITTLAHLQADFGRHVGDDDLTHLDEVLARHDLRRDPGAGSREQFEARARANPANRRLHHHVFDLALIDAALADAGWKVRAAEALVPMHLVAWAQNPAA